ncbi:MAG: hypothetical protein HZA24_03660 [Nitrospirae bacterium]|nr:hypothetical protein [Nitrospirota bacterium]
MICSRPTPGTVPLPPWRRLLPALLCLVALSGCALQSDVVELGANVEEIQDLQKKLERQLAEAEEATETVRAMRVRMDTVEEKLREGVSPELESRITLGLKSLERAQKDLQEERKLTADRLGEAEKFFVGRVQEVSADQQDVMDRVAIVEARLGTALRAQQAAPAAPGGGVRQPGDDPYLQWIDERLGQLTGKIHKLEKDARQAAEATPAPDARVDELAKTVEALKSQVGAAGASADLAETKAELIRRIAALEAANTARGAEGERRIDQIAETVDVRLARMEQQQGEQGKPVSELQQNLARQEQTLAALDQRLAALGTALDSATGPTAANLVQLAQRVDVLQQGAQTEIAQLKAGMQTLAQRVGPGVGPNAAEAAALADMSGQVELLAAALDQRIGRLEAGSPPGGGRAGATQAPPELAERVARQEEALQHLERRLAAVQTDPQVAFLNDRMETLASGVDQRLAVLEQRAPGSAGDAGQVAGLSGQLAMLEATLDQRIQRLEQGAGAEPQTAALADRLARQEQTLDALDRRLAAVQTDPQQAFVEARIDELSRRVDARLGELSEAIAKGPQPAQPDSAALADMSGQVALLEASLADRIAHLEQRVQERPAAPAPDAASGTAVAAMGERFDQLAGRLQELEQAQLADMAALRQQVRVLAERIAAVGAGGAP